MNCPRCHVTTVRGAKYCIRCGQPLTSPTETAATGSSTTDLQSVAPLVEWKVGDVLLGEFTVERPLGAGGMGAVHLVRSRTTGEPFALKTLTIPNVAHRRLFFNELQTWIGLPQHPHLTACRFFRTINDQVAIFAEYVPGGSLAEAIANGSLSQLDHRLDVLIQFAWGLHAAHQWGVVHRDAKPANVLLRRERPDASPTVKVCDFGVSSARAAVGLMSSDGRCVRVSSGGMTVAYRSPEQAAQRSVTHKTDVWSWGVSVLEMICGGVQWMAGEFADEALEQLVQDRDQLLTTWPAELIDLLRRCLRRDPDERPADLLTVAEALRAVFRRTVGREHPRSVPTFPERPSTSNSDRGSDEGGARHWLGVALAAAGRDTQEAESWFAESYASQAARWVDELKGFDEAKRMLERLVAQGNDDATESLVRTCVAASHVHRIAGDHAGAHALLDRAVETGAGWFDRPDAPWSRCFALLGAYLEKARTLGFGGRPADAAGLFDVGLSFLLVKRQRSNNIDDAFIADGFLTQLLFYKGCVCYEMCDYTAAEGLFRRSINHYAVAFKEGLPRPAAETLAHAYKNLSTVLVKQGKHAEAELWSRRAIELSTDLHGELASDDALELLTSSMIQQAGVHLASGNPQAARDLMLQAVERWERVVQGRYDDPKACQLSKVYGNLAVAVNRCGDHLGSLPLFEKSAAILDHWIRLKGRADLEPELTHVLLNQEVPLRRLQRWSEARAVLQDLIGRLDRLIAEGRGGDELQHRLALALSDLAYVDVQQGRDAQAVAIYERCRYIWRRLVYDRGRRELTEYLESTETNLRNLT